MMRVIGALAVTLLLVACGQAPPQTPGRAYIGRSAELILPTPPNYPETRIVAQTILAQYGKQKMAFETYASLSPSVVTVTVTAPSGPRLARINWTAEGISGERAPQTPGNLRNENLLADMMIALWPREAVEKALDPAGSVIDEPDGTRRVIVGGETLIEIVPDPGKPGTRVLRNRQFDYSLTIVTEPEG